MIYLELLWSFFQIGLFSIGGGYAAMPLIQNQVVDVHPWLTMTQFADIMTIADLIMYFMLYLLVSNNGIQQYSGCTCPQHHINWIYFPFPQNQKASCKNHYGNYVDSTQVNRQGSFSVKSHDY